VRCRIAGLLTGHRFRSNLVLAGLIVTSFPVALLCAHSSDTATAAKVDADALVRDVIHNEIQAQIHDNSLWCFREEHQEDGKPAKTLDVCESKDGDIERLVAVNGKPLDRAQQAAEDQRIQRLLNHPDQLRANQKKQREDGEQERNMLKPFPEAFRFHCESIESDRVTLRFQPNPNFRPASRTAMVFHHLEGSMIVDARQKRIIEINGKLTSEVKFAGGLLGHLDKNGSFFVRQEQVAPGHWDLKSLRVLMNGKALFFKMINVVEKKEISDYRPLPQGTTLQQAAARLQSDFAIRAASNAGR
jgi:hypothetical protein